MKNEILNDIKNIKTNFKTKNYKKELPNILTSIRLLAPFILIPLFYYNKMCLAIIMIVLFSLTDTFDGYFARKYNNSLREIYCISLPICHTTIFKDL